MLTQTGIAIAKNPMANMTALAIHCVVSTLRKPSWLYQSQSAYSPEKMKNPMTSAAITAMAITNGVRERRAG